MKGYTLPKMTRRITKSAKSCESKITMRQAVGTSTWQAGKTRHLGRACRAVSRQTEKGSVRVALARSRSVSENTPVVAAEICAHSRLSQQRLWSICRRYRLDGFI